MGLNNHADDELVEHHFVTNKCHEWLAKIKLCRMTALLMNAKFDVTKRENKETV